MAQTPPPPPAAPPPPPPLVRAGDGYTWHPADPVGGPTQTSTVARPGQRANQRRGGIVGGLLAIGYAILKYGIFVLKFGKLGGTFISFGLSLLLYVALFGWQFGVGALLLIAIHELGHMLFARAQGLQVSAPIFLGWFGALIRTRQPFRSARQEAIVAIGGPVTGTAAALLCYIFALSLPSGHLHNLMLSLAYFGCLVNLFNLIPMSPLDGGRVASAVSRWANVAGVAIIVVLIAGYYLGGYPVNPFLVLILLFGIISTVGRFRRHAAGEALPPLSPATRTGIGVAYAVMLVISAAGMSAAHSALLSSGIGQPIV